MTTVYEPLSNTTTDVPLPPLAPGAPLLGHALEMYSNPILHMRDLYYKLGPIYRVRVPGREFTIMAGIEANQMLSGTGDMYFRSAGEFDEFEQEMQASHFLINMDGEEHKRMRRLLRPGYSRRLYVQKTEEAVAITRRHVQGWKEGALLGVLDACQRIITEQIGALLIGHAPGDYFDDLRLFMNTVLRTLVTKTWPRVMLYRPAYRRAKARIWELARQVTDEVRHLPPEERPRGLLRDLLQHYESGGDLVSDEDDLLAAVVGPYLAGLDTVAGTMAFAIFAFLKHGVWQTLSEESDALFAEGPLTASSLRNAPLLHAALMESIRMYSVASFTPRVVAQSFVFRGYRVDAGTRVLIANGLTHYLPEFFPEPDRFDLTRHLPPRKEYRQAGAFTPFSLGPHTCLGAGTGEAQLMVTLATILHSVELALEPPDYQVKQALTPIPSPGFGFKVRVVRKR
ncbi:MAG: cytochrome P450 [Anaerolineae bacterium]|nr:MAG: cytochrome P450 [Anaerolineae bacterium]